MADVNDGEQRVADGLAYVCAHLDQLRADLQRDATVGDHPLQVLLVAVAAGGDVAGALDVLHAAVRAGGDVLGVYGHEGRALRPPGIETGPLEFFYPCPTGRCSGRCWPQPPGVPLRCAISGGRDLLRERI
ncbi:hypothetical protein ACIRLA_25480 [Streptomyces sp. NPDC102364]|uniref:hypothetical protein n=1 Tax=Streptomyces sp. NPDC102364 TaxID=3366161 RepID=UPI003826A80B